MKRVLFEGVAVLALTATVPALAVEPVNAAPYLPAAATPVFNWTGFYLGAHAGYARAELNTDGNNSLDPLTPKGWYGGGQLGFNWQAAPNWVWGLETDLSSGYRDRIFDGKNVADIRFVGTARARVGWAQSNAWFYATGGFAYAQEKISVRSAGTSAAETQLHPGWTLGGGLEWAFAPAWSVKLEWLHIELARRRYALDGPANCGVASCDVGLRIETIKAGLNWRFPVGAPPP
jgi:outer membrane immunogenic protein